jgi:hypothetical protein
VRSGVTEDVKQDLVLWLFGILLDDWDAGEKKFLLCGVGPVEHVWGGGLEDEEACCWVEGLVGCGVFSYLVGEGGEPGGYNYEGWGVGGRCGALLWGFMKENAISQGLKCRKSFGGPL